MSENLHSDVLTVGVGGAAGGGVKSAGIKVAQLLHSLGFQVYISFDYPSLIRGGHNFARLTVSKEKVWSDHSELDILVALNDKTAELHKNEIKEDTVVISDLDQSEVVEKIKPILKEKGINPDTKIGEANNELIDGNSAFGRGLLAAGVDFYIAYPMTPSTSILHYMASRTKDTKLKVIQPENEIAVINMALGVAYAGKRAAIGTATGGFALMQEAFSLSGMAEIPLVVAVSQRQAPASGVPTYSSQADLRFILHSGHGEFPRIVIAPGDQEESFYLGAEALNLAWKYQVPVVIILDKILSEHMMTVSVDESKISIERGKILENADENYKRYEFVEDGISPLAFPGTENVVVKADSYEHTEDGITTEVAEEVEKMMNKRFLKRETIKKELDSQDSLKIYGNQDSKNVVVFWGSTKGAMLETLKYLNKEAKLIQILWLEPFDEEKVKKELQGSENIICVEGNHDGQLASLIREKTGIEVKNKILKYDSRPFDPVKLAKEINNKL